MIFILIAEAILFLGLVFYLIFMLDHALRAHDLPTTKRAMREIVRISGKYAPGARKFCDLGCARGTLVLAIKKDMPNLAVRGVDISGFRLFVAKIKAFLLGRDIEFEKNDIFSADISDADVIYTYLWYDTMPPLEKSLEKSAKPGAVIITNTSWFPGWEPVETVVTFPKKPDFEKLFVYIKK
jgi:hypothetical protein